MRNVKTLASLLLAAVAVFAGETRLGKPLTLKSAVPVGQLMSAPDTFVDKVIQVRGKVTEVCTMMGCWMQLVDGEQAVRVKVNDGDIVFPKSSVGKNAIAEGTLKKF